MSGNKVKKSKESSKAEPKDLRAKSFWSRNAHPLIILAFTLFLYTNSIFNGYNLDDELVTRNHPLTSQGIKALPEIFSSPYYKDNMGYAYDYRPIVHASFAIEHQLFGEHAIAGHLFNALIYLGCSLLVYFVLILLNASSSVSLFTTLLFVAFPLHTEAVCSIKNRDELLSLLFALSTLWLASKVHLNSFTWLIPVALIFTLSLLSKYSLVVFAFIIPAVIYLRYNLTLKYVLSIAIALAVPGAIFFQQPTLLFRASFFGAIIVFPCLFYIPYQKIFEFVLLVCKKIVHAVSRLLLFVFNDFERFLKGISLPIYKTPVANNYKHSVLFASIIIVAVFIAFAVGIINSNLVVVGGWVIMVALLMQLLKESHLKTAIAFVFFGGVFLLLLLWRSIDSVNPIPILITTYAVLAYIQKRSKKETLFYLLLMALITVFQLVVIEDIGALFPLIALVNIYVQRRSTIAYLITKYGLHLLLVIQSIVFALSLFEQNPADSIAFEAFTWICLVVSNILVLKPDKAEGLKHIAFVVLVSATLFCLPHITFPQKFIDYLKEQISASHSTGYHTPVTAPTSRRITTLQQDTLQSFVILPLKTDRQFNYVESPVKTWDDLNTRIASASDVALHYIQKTLVPYPMAFYYGYRVFKPEKLDSLPVVLSLFLHFALAILFVFCFTHHRLIATGLFIYLLSIVALSGFFQTISGVVADRFSLVPSLGFCVVFSAIVFNLFKIKLNDENLTVSNTPRAIKLIFIGVLTIYSGITIARNAQWKDDLTLMRHDIKYVSESAQANNLLAIHLINQSFRESNATEQVALRKEALVHFKKAQQIYPPFFNVAYDIGRTYVLLNQPDSAIEAFKYSLTLDTTYSDIYINLGEQCMNTQNYVEAAKYLAKYIQMQPNEYDGYDKLSYVYYQMGNYEASVQTNKLAVARIPNIADPYANIGRVYLVTQERDSAIYYLTIADKMVPGNQQIQLFLQQAKNLK